MDVVPSALSCVMDAMLIATLGDDQIADAR